MMIRIWLPEPCLRETIRQARSSGVRGSGRSTFPQGKFGTFNLGLADPNQSAAEFQFYWPRVFVQFDAYNAGNTEAIITVRCPEMHEVTFRVGPGELRRLHTNWGSPSSKVSIRIQECSRPSTR